MGAFRPKHSFASNGSRRRARSAVRRRSHSQSITTRDHIERLAGRAVGACENLLNHCAIEYRDINAGSGVVFIGWGKHRWAPIGPYGQRALGDARRAVEELDAVLRAATDVAAPDRSFRAEDLTGALRRVAAQSDATAGAGFQSIEAARQAVTRAEDEVRAFIDLLPSAHGPGGRLLVPDSNAVVWQPDLAAWDFGEGTLVLVPTVVVELDELKTRAGGAGEKAAKAIKVLNGMERRGDTFAGVKLSGRGRLRELPVDPPLPLKPPWMTEDHADDRILAAAMGLALADLDADVVLVTRDRNMRNKARLAGLGVQDVTDITPPG